MKQQWIWVALDVAIAAHAEQIAEHGGDEGIREAGLLDSAMARPQNLALYGDPDVSELAASYAFVIARNHPFVDGNKRAALGACLVFLRLNGRTPQRDGPEWEELVLAVAAGEFDREQTARGLRKLVREPK